MDKIINLVNEVTATLDKFGGWETKIRRKDYGIIYTSMIVSLLFSIYGTLVVDNGNDFFKVLFFALTNNGSSIPKMHLIYNNVTKPATASLFRQWSKRLGFKTPSPDLETIIPVPVIVTISVLKYVVEILTESWTFVYCGISAWALLFTRIYQRLGVKVKVNLDYGCQQLQVKTRLTLFRNI